MRQGYIGLLILLLSLAIIGLLFYWQMQAWPSAQVSGGANQQSLLDKAKQLQNDEEQRQQNQLQMLQP